MSLTAFANTYRRYMARHLRIARPGGVLRGADGAPVAAVEQVIRHQGQLVVSGWARDTVRLSSDGHGAEAAPSLPRSAPDDPLAPPRYDGFEIALPAGTQPATLSVETSGGAVSLTLPVVPAWQMARARLATSLCFGRDAAACVPDTLRFLRHNDIAAKARVKARLGFETTLVQRPLDPALFGVAPDGARIGVAPDGAQLNVAPDGALFGFDTDGSLHGAAPDGLPATATPGGAPFDPAPGGARPSDVNPQPVQIVMPVFNAFDVMTQAVQRVLAHTPPPFRLIVIEDASDDARVRPWLRALAGTHPDCVTLLENAANLGFVGSMNRGFAEALTAPGHVVALNADALVPANWCPRLLAPILADPSVATVTPMTNDGEIATVPVICAPVPLAEGQAARIDALAARLSPPAALAEAPTAVGFCMAINRRFLERTPLFDTAFGRGYGEEVDWCQKLRAMGGRHLLTGTLFVEHRGGASFGSAEKRARIARNGALITRRYPGYDAEVQAFLATDPMISPRLALGLALAGAAGDVPVPVYLAHSLGGGAETDLQRRLRADLARGMRPVVLRVGGHAAWQIDLMGPGDATTGAAPAATGGFAANPDTAAPRGAVNSGTVNSGSGNSGADTSGPAKADPSGSTPLASTDAAQSINDGAGRTTSTGVTSTEDIGTKADAASGTTPSVTSGTTPSVTSGTTPSVTSGTTPSVTSGTTPSVTSGTTPSVTSGTTPSVTSGTTPSVTSGTTPSVTSGTTPSVTSGTTPSVTSGTTPSVTSGTTPSVTSGTTGDERLVRQLLALLPRRHMIYSCGVGAADPRAVPRLLTDMAGKDDRLTVLMHDFLPISPSYTLLDSTGRYAGIPDADSTDPAHVYRSGALRLSPADWRAAWRPVMARADEIVAFSTASAALVEAAFPGLQMPLRIRPHSLHSAVPVCPPGRRASGHVIGVLGNIGLQKGAAVLSRMSAHLGRGDAPVSVAVIGDFDLNFRVRQGLSVHGPYRLAELDRLVARYGIECWLIPSVWPETFSFTTHEALATSLPVFCADLGAQADAVRAAGNGQVLRADPQDETTILAEICDTMGWARPATLPARSTVA